MKLILLAEHRTKRETIDYLAEGIRKVVPVSLDLSISGQRYSSGRRYSGFYDLGSVGRRFASEGLDEYLLMLVHSSFIYSGGNVVIHPGLVGRDKFGDILYAGRYDHDKKIFLVGGDNSISDNNVKVASHEIAHAILDPINGVWTETEFGIVQASHCKNYVDGKRCIMHSAKRATRESLEEMHLGFCQSCTDKMKNGKK